ncbi:MAG: carbohydrate-binding protein, partial [Fibrobacter sp.]|nr:carbohydrate-binding protein [Fibrobacter sp.]
QPPHVSYYLPDMVKNLKKPDIYMLGTEGVAGLAPTISKVGDGLENQGILLGNAIESFGYKFIGCDGVKVTGLPKGVTAKVEGSTVTISGTPTEAGVFAYTVVTEGGEGDAASAKGVLSVAAPGNAEEVATKKEASKVDASTPDAGIGWSETTNTGFVEKGYFNFDNSTASYGTWNLYSEHTASTTISIRFANGGSAARDMELVVNGVKVGTVSMDATGGWTTWLTTDAKIDLAKGLNTITLKSTTADGGANVDVFYFDIEGVSAYAGQVDEQTTIKPVAASVRGMVFNPSTGVLYTPKAGLAEIYFYDMSGAMRLGVSRNVTAGATSVAYDRELLPKGMYVVKVKLDGKLVAATRMVK